MGSPLLTCRAALLGMAILAGAPAGAEQPPRSPAAQDARAAVAALERQRAAAFQRRDIAALRSLMDRQYYHVESRGRARSKTELLTALEHDGLRVRNYEIESSEIQLLGDGGTALVTGTFRTLMEGPPPKPFRGRFARLWVRQPDGWKNTFHQATEIRPAQDSCECN
ncbi:nuclear transport factor 2 family protein [Massilia oculi]|uniref:Nuclear transport factor 2 family protein n=1 Tax=Massilia hydrophila TaxID=3044279 RepID=A0ABS7Y9V5_9BURK|nr:nuclear transport factor 2 family protein [Massilia oculi]MCA1855099.1 nuclear transport factor 2 family protein [Massilia oculi]